MKCPACGAEMMVAPISHHALACVACGGLWAGTGAARRIETAMDAEILALVDKTEAGARHAGDPTRERWCPDCGAPLERIRKAKTELDVCPQHGTWFDPGEVRRVAEILAKGRKPKKAEAEVGSRGESAAVETSSSSPPKKKKDADWSILEGAGVALELLAAIF